MSQTNNKIDPINVGDIAPDFVLTDSAGHTHRLSEIAAQQAVVLVFYRGDWCPYCQIQLHQLGSRSQDFHQKGARVLAISPQKHELNQAFAEKRQVPFPIVWDENQSVISEWGLRHELDEHQEHIPYPTTYVIGAGNRLLWRKLGVNKSDRPHPEEILAALPPSTAVV